MTANEPDPRTLKHRPVVLMDYASHDGFYPANRTDCRYLSIGWAQYDPRQLSVKTLRHTGDRWSRQSEELPLHRCIDAASLIAEVLAQTRGSSQITIREGFLERQDQEIFLPLEFANDRERSDFEAKLTDPLTIRRLGKLADVLLALRRVGLV
jgi:hypothetical protein